MAVIRPWADTEFGLQIGFGNYIKRKNYYTMKRSELLFSVLLVPVDYVLVVLAGITAYSLRFSTFSQALPVSFELALTDYLGILLPAAVVWLLVFGFSGLYSMRLKYSRLSEFLKVFVASSAAVSFLIFVIFFRQELFASRFIILATWILSGLYVGIGRLIVRNAQHFLVKKGIGSRHLVLFTNQEDKHNLKNTFIEHPEFGFSVIRHYFEFNEQVKKEILELDAQGGLDDILLADPGNNQDTLLTLEEFCSEHHINFIYTADLFPIPMTNFHLGTLAGVPVIELARTRLEGWGKVWKRLFDVVIATLLIIVLSPVFLLVALMVRLDSSGKPVIRLMRVGERGKTFSMYKFRSMVENAEQLKEQLLKYNERKDGPLFKMHNDPRITRVGKFIRKTSLDEIPQLFNVFQGEMSLVGPRPHEPNEVAKYSSSQKKLLTIKPGMTGLAQVSGRSDLQFGQEAQLDIYYIEHWSLGLDLTILLKTPTAVFFKGSV